MCILFWTVDNHPKYRFVFAGNRDEFLERPTARAQFWSEPNSHVLAGIDLEAQADEPHLNNGTWLGITKQGRFSALTNFREQKVPRAVSRGVLVSDYLLGNDSVQQLNKQGNDFGGFNLICFDFNKGKNVPVEMEYITNRGEESEKNLKLKPAVVYGLSNSLLSNPWPKVNQGCTTFEEILKDNDGSDKDILIESLFSLLKSSKPMSNDKDLKTIFNDLMGRIYVPRFDFPISSIKEPSYGTRTSTVVLIDYDNNVHFVEREWDVDTNINNSSCKEQLHYDDRSYEFTLDT